MLMLAAACSCSSGKEMATVNEEPKMEETVEATVRETAEEKTDTQEGIGVNFQEIELEEEDYNPDDIFKVNPNGTESLS